MEGFISSVIKVTAVPAYWITLTRKVCEWVESLFYNAVFEFLTLTPREKISLLTRSLKSAFITFT